MLTPTSRYQLPIIFWTYTYVVFFLEGNIENSSKLYLFSEFGVLFQAHLVGTYQKIIQVRIIPWARFFFLDLPSRYIPTHQNIWQPRETSRILRSLNHFSDLT